MSGKFVGRFRGTVISHKAVKSEQKKTPGLEFLVAVHEKKRGAEWVQLPSEFNRVVTLWFKEGGNHEWTMKRLAFAGYSGGPLSQMKLAGRTVELECREESYKGKAQERYELALPERTTESDEDAFLAIDAILGSEPLPDVEGAAQSAVSTPDENPVDKFYDSEDSAPDDDDGVPF